MKKTLQALVNGDVDIPGIIRLLGLKDQSEVDALHKTACTMRDEALGPRLAVRALVEISSICKNGCLYCGLNCHNKNASRYRMSTEAILECAMHANEKGISTIVMQSGEDGRSADEIAEIISAIKSRYGMAVTLSLGERPHIDYRLWKEAGADRYLLRIEATDPGLYASLHRTRRLDSRLAALESLQKLGYQTGSGTMIGSPGQSLENIARDIMFFYSRRFEMVGIGPFIPHPATVFADHPHGDPALVLNAIAITRILLPKAWMPATTALGSLESDWRDAALKAGANVLMPNFSPGSCRPAYDIYPGKHCINEDEKSVREECECFAKNAGLHVDWGRADAPGFSGFSL